MIAWWWLLIVSPIAAIFGYFICALMVIASEGAKGRPE